MRENKENYFRFRAWDRTKNRMLFLSGIFNNIPYTEKSTFPQYDSSKEYHDLKIMHCINLRDKNGELIYERDLCQSEVTVNKETHGDWALYEIIMKNGLTFCSYVRSQKGEIVPRGYMGCCINELDDISHKLLFMSNDYRIPIEIIGNIHENPELLKGN